MVDIFCSVVVPAYNAADVLPCCLNALAKQSISSFSYEVIVVDDGSSDRTSKIAEEFGVKVIRQLNKGPAAARNCGAAHASGEFLLFTDADCKPDPGWIRYMIEGVEDGVDGVQGVYRTEQTGLVPRFVQSEFEQRYRLMRKFDSIDLVATYAAGYRKHVFIDAGGFDETYTCPSNEDTELSYRLVDAGCKLVLAEKAVVVHRHPESLARYMRVKFGRAMWRIKVYRSYPHKVVRDRYTTLSVKLQTAAMLLCFFSCCLGLFFPQMLKISFVILFAIAFSAIPFSLKNMQRDKYLGLFTPLAVVFRSIALAAGTLAGLLKR